MTCRGILERFHLVSIGEGEGAPTYFLGEKKDPAPVVEFRLITSSAF